MYSINEGSMDFIYYGDSKVKKTFIIEFNTKGNIISCYYECDWNPLISDEENEMRILESLELASQEYEARF